MVQNSDNIDIELAEVSTKKYQPKVKLAGYRPRWVKMDLNLAHEEAKFQWKAVPHEPTEHDLSPVSLIESIFTRALMDLICRDSNEYASQKGHQNFDLDVPTLAILLSADMSLCLVVPCTGRSMEMYTI